MYTYKQRVLRKDMIVLVCVHGKSVSTPVSSPGVLIQPQLKVHSDERVSHKQ